jgi:beta-lactam-binding protein with PASTA domain
MDAVNRLIRSNQPFVFTQKKEEVNGRNSFVLTQSPKAGDSVESGTKIELAVSTPEKLASDETFGILEAALPEYPVSVDLTVEKIVAGGRSEIVFEMKHPGGQFSMPYREKKGTVILIKIYDEEVKRFSLE